jgi:hypothetical protein
MEKQAEVGLAQAQPTRGDFLHRFARIRGEMRVRDYLVLLLLIGVTVSASGCSSADSRARPGAAAEGASSHTTRLSFGPREGWYTAETYLAHDQIPVAWAANVPFAADDAGHEFPQRTIDGLPTGGIVLVAVGPRPYTGDTEFQRLPLPLKLADGNLLVGTTYEGQPAPHVSFFEADGWLRDELTNVWGYLGENPPSAAMRAEADKELAALAFR